MNLPIEILHADCDARFWRGRVQSHGRLLAFSEENLRLVSWSGTWPRPLATDDELEDVIGMQAAHALRNLLAKTGSTPSPGILSGVELSGEEQSFDVFIHRYSGHVIVELEEATAGESLIQSAIDPAQALARRLQASMSAERMAATATRIAGALLGYDRALLYRVSNTGEARIMAETLRAGSRLGSLADSAPLAEAVFLAGNPPLPAIRMIADTGSETMPMMPDGMANEQPDLAHAQLRCLLPEHAAALARHGIAASLIVPLMGENGLWGVLSCHHPSPRRLTAPERAGLELFGRILALQLTEAERRDARLREEEARQQLRQMTLEIRQEARAADMPSMHAHVPALATLLRADGVAYGESGRWLAHGATPDMHGLEQITALSDSTGDIYETNDLAGLGQPLGRADLRALLIVPLSLSPRRHLIFFRVAGPAGVTGQRGPFCREDRARHRGRTQGRLRGYRGIPARPAGAPGKAAPADPGRAEPPDQEHHHAHSFHRAPDRRPCRFRPGFFRNAGGASSGTLTRP
ncbi:GAF domain-containing protein [Gellertiella hungarica]|uniref:Light-regulated signal transduction histidine kinase (Bacteriophytochrome) n=1 Tax=Gellertiella hungarica TaxID=1572859 RepID=A0A7W6J9Y0_9HYPH|nr:GAF domain-containing protein [Gellertiella hungarica]MBB4066602.1 light-regulated signal transduction histidine kinase (bacteriophytochrome) [Gellertiella hungarica]